MFPIVFEQVRELIGDHGKPSSQAIGEFGMLCPPDAVQQGVTVRQC